MVEEVHNRTVSELREMVDEPEQTYNAMGTGIGGLTYSDLIEFMDKVDAADGAECTVVATEDSPPQIAEINVRTPISTEPLVSVAEFIDDHVRMQDLMRYDAEPYKDGYHISFAIGH